MKRLILIFFALNVLSFAFLSHRCSRPGMEKRLEAAVNDQLQGRMEFQHAEFEVHDLDVILTGQVPSAAARKELVQLVSHDLPAGRVRERMEVVAPVPASLQVTLEQGILRLRGNLPSAALIRELKRTGEELGFSVLTLGLQSAKQVESPDWLEGLSGFIHVFFQGAETAAFQAGDGEWVIERQVDTPEIAHKLRNSAVAILPLGTKLLDEVSVRPADLPSRLVVCREGNSMVVSGAVPSEAYRSSIIEAVVRAVGENLTNDLHLDRKTKPPLWLPALSGILAPLFAEGNDQRIEVSGSQVKVCGKFATDEECANLMELAGTAFGVGFVVESALETVPEMRPPPPHLEWAASFSQDDLQFSGIVPDAQTRDRIIGAFRRSYFQAKMEEPGVKLDSRVAVPDWLGPLLDFASRLPDHLKGSGELRIANQKAELSGTAKSQASADALGLKLERMLGDGFAVENRVTVVEGSGQTLGQWGHGAIYFNSGASELSSSQLPGIERAAGSFQEAGPYAVILIEALADNTGTRAQNLSLGNRRALAVRQAFMSHEVPSSAIELVGVRIVTSSRNPELDRRVEFTIIP